MALLTDVINGATAPHIPVLWALALDMLRSNRISVIVIHNASFCLAPVALV